MLTKALSLIYQQSWLIKEIPGVWKLANILSIYKKGWREDLGNQRPVSLTSVLGKVMEQIILSAVTQHVQHSQGIRHSQHKHGVVKGRSCWTNLISFYDKVTHLADERRSVDVVCLKFDKVLDTVSHRILLKELAAHVLDRFSLFG
ncbi:RNA-directed DNA polymerase from mobile element jockey-like protein [Turdus rufiventris]|nr:RNA-directed DNA polymerase from mobile element jockey-like protein [Turdus rufiventris]